MIYLKDCPRCKGDLYDSSDKHGSFVSCFQCGYLKEKNESNGILPTITESTLEGMVKIRSVQVESDLVDKAMWMLHYLDSSNEPVRAVDLVRRLGIKSNIIDQNNAELRKLNYTEGVKLTSKKAAYIVNSITDIGRKVSEDYFKLVEETKKATLRDYSDNGDTGDGWDSDEEVLVESPLEAEQNSPKFLTFELFESGYKLTDFGELAKSNPEGNYDALSLYIINTERLRKKNKSKKKK